MARCYRQLRIADGVKRNACPIMVDDIGKTRYSLQTEFTFHGERGPPDIALVRLTFPPAWRG